MANLGTTFSRDELPVSQGFDPIPAGWYTATITGEEFKNTKAGDGQYINVQYTITGPEHQGRPVFGIINIRNPSTQCQEIGLANLNALMAATGFGEKEKLIDSSQLVGRDCQIKISVKAAVLNDDKSEKYPAGNDVKGWKPLEGGFKSPTSAPVTKKPAFAR